MLSSYALLMPSHHLETVPVSVRIEDPGDWRAKKLLSVSASSLADLHVPSVVKTSLLVQNFGAGD